MTGRINISYFMANIAGAHKCNNEDEEGRSDIEIVTKKIKQPFHKLKVTKRKMHCLLLQTVLLQSQ